MAKNKKQFQEAREAMIDSQIHPMGVVSEALLEVMGRVPREDFVPADKQGICYCDEDIEITQGRYLMEPSVLARLIQAADIAPSDVALTIGSGVGYNAAILSQLASTVVALEEDMSLIQVAQACWDKHSFCNIVAVTGPLQEGAPVNAPYDVIIVNGAVAKTPAAFKGQLNEGGRLLVLERSNPTNVAKATLIKKISEGVYSNKILFDAGTPYLKGFAPEKEFVF